MKALFFDIDGTLIEGRDPKFNKPTVKTVEALKKLQENGDKIFICSGRGLTYLDKGILDIGFDGYILLNGATVFYDNKLIYAHTMDKKEVLPLMEYYESLGMEYAILDIDKTYVKKEFHNFQKRLMNYNIDKSAYTTDFNMDDINICKLELSSTDFSNEEKVINSLPKDLTYVVDPFNKECAIDIFPKNINKALGIQKIMEHLNIDQKDTFAFGDGDNDIEMLSFVANGFAMGNGTERAKKAAKIIVPSIFDDGVAFGINEYILK